MNYRALSLLTVSLMLVAACDYKPRNQGRSLYAKHCQGCHMEDGQGLGALMPPVRNADYVLANKDSLACIIRDGMSHKITVNGVEYEGEMPANPRLTEIEINNLIHYILVDLNGEEQSFDINAVRSQLSNCR